VGLRRWGGNVLINKLAPSLELRQVHVPESYVSPEGCTGICSNWHILHDDCIHLLVFWASHCATATVIIGCQRVIHLLNVLLHVVFITLWGFLSSREYIAVSYPRRMESLATPVWKSRKNSLLSAKHSYYPVLWYSNMVRLLFTVVWLSLHYCTVRLKWHDKTCSHTK
jgi:hypothetical protein